MLLKKGQTIILLVNLASTLFFAYLFATKAPKEAIIFAMFMMLLYGFFLFTNKAVEYPNSLLWGLTLWGTLHMAGGALMIGGKSLYNFILIPVTDDIFRYDQLIHIIGFGVATAVMYHAAKRFIQFKREYWLSWGLLVVFSGLGIGALNEIVEFLITVTTGVSVGGYLNTSLDLISDLVGASITFVYLLIAERNK